MVALNDELFQTLIRHFDLTKEDLTYLDGGREDSDGITYTYNKNGRRYVLKISAREKAGGIDSLLEKLKFARFLGENGVSVACPREDQNGRIFYIEEDERFYFAVIIMDFFEGGSPRGSEVHKYAYEWGKMVGKMHRLTKTYPIWKNLQGIEGMYGYEMEIQYMFNRCNNEFVKKKWLEIKTELSKLELNRDCYGLIHNDNHQYNIIAGKEGITLLDFDCAECNFMINDVLLPIQEMLFDSSGGMMGPVRDPDQIKRFYDAFLKGYETESHISTYWLDKMELFLNYRRLLIFTVSPGWMEQDKNAKNAFLEMIQNPVPICVY